MSGITRGLETYLAYKMLDLIATPFTEWRAFELGLIDSTGKKIKEAKSNEEKEQFSKFMNIARNLKRILSKYANVENKLGAVLVGTALLKEQNENVDFDLVEEVVVGNVKTKYPPNTEASLKVLESGKYKFQSDFYEDIGETFIYAEHRILSDEFGVFCVSDVMNRKVLGTIEDFQRID